jgi:hypothetical protein
MWMEGWAVMNAMRGFAGRRRRRGGRVGRGGGGAGGRKRCCGGGDCTAIWEAAFGLGTAMRRDKSQRNTNGEEDGEQIGGGSGQWYALTVIL